jgi:pimeloyl-ACP methyl ester carboxylesterase
VDYNEKYIQTNGIRLHVIEAGPRLGVPVILLHGFPEFWYGWRNQIPALAQAGYRVIVPDQRGYNLSDKPVGIRSYRLSELAADILGLIDAYEYDKVNLAGHDWGAMVAWSLALGQPERLHRLGIMNGPHPAVLAKFWLNSLEQIKRSWYVLFFQLPLLPENSLRADHFRGLARAMRGSGRMHTFTNEHMKKYLEAWSRPGALTAMLNWYRALPLNHPLLTGKLRTSVPTLILWGLKDKALSHRLARPSVDYCDDGKLILFPDDTHWVQHESAEEVNRWLIEFFRN